VYITVSSIGKSCPKTTWGKWKSASLSNEGGGRRYADMENDVTVKTEVGTFLFVIHEQAT